MSETLFDARVRSAGPPHVSQGSEPVFRAPWEAQAFALAVALHERGAFTWAEWTETLSAVIAEARAGDDDYYRSWTAALERLVERKGMLTPSQLDARRYAWEEAARRTPHGQPIELKEH